MDVKTAYSNAPVDCEIYMEQPEGFEVSDKSVQKLVYRLNKSLNGLKHSARNWNQMLHTFLKENGFVESISGGYFHNKHDGKGLIRIYDPSLG